MRWEMGDGQMMVIFNNLFLFEELKAGQILMNEIKQQQKSLQMCPSLHNLCSASMISNQPNLSYPCADNPLTSNQCIVQSSNDKVQLRKFLRIRNQQQFKKEYRFFKNYFQNHQNIQFKQKNNRNNRNNRNNKQPLQFLPKIQVPLKTSIFIHITQDIKTNRLNLVVRTFTGIILGYYFAIKNIKKNNKIKKIIVYFKQAVNITIIDQTFVDNLKINIYLALFDLTKQIIWVFKKVSSNCRKQLSVNGAKLINFRNINLSNKCKLIHQQGSISLLKGDFCQDRSQLEIILKSCYEVLDKQQRLLQSIREKKEMFSKDIAMDSLLVNYNYSQNILPNQIINKIQYLFERQNQKMLMGCSDNEKTGHYPFKMQICRDCVQCKINGGKKKIKSKYKCIQCTLEKGQNIVLCLTCFKPYHLNQNYNHTLQSREQISKQSEYGEQNSLRSANENDLSTIQDDKNHLLQLLQQVFAYLEKMRSNGRIQAVDRFKDIFASKLLIKANQFHQKFHNSQVNNSYAFQQSIFQQQQQKTDHNENLLNKSQQPTHHEEFPYKRLIQSPHQLKQQQYGLFYQPKQALYQPQLFYPIQIPPKNVSNFQNCYPIPSQNYPQIQLFPNSAQLESVLPFSQSEIKQQSQQQSQQKDHDD